MLSYADLKKYKFHHLFAFPAFAASPTWSTLGAPSQFTSDETTALVDKVSTWRYAADSRQRGFFLAKRIDSDFEIGSLGDYERGFFTDVPEADRFISVVDPSEYADSPGWPLRNLLLLIRKRWGLSSAQILCYRDSHAERHLPKSIILSLQLPDDPAALSLSDDLPKIVGWEKDATNSIRPRIANLSAQMDPKIQADISVDLNLKLMKWRVAPTLDLDKLKHTKCLLLGAGTLGAYVSRLLLGWGVQKITLIDSGNVSFSNPVRQPLFTFNDCIGGATQKAPAAAAALKEIYPGVDATGITMTVPMAAHPFSAAAEPQVRADYERLQSLFEEHDAIFLLMDTRESRWLPTVMGKSMGKIVMNAALGFDSYVVMRHGVKPTSPEGEELGCYYCNDVVAPGDSLTDRTLDQQCTVTRPGIAPLASALLVELLVSVVQSPLGPACPAPNPRETNPSPQGEHPLGSVPHQMRGFLNAWNNMVVKGSAYDCCSACSDKVIDEYKLGGWEFVKRALCEKGWVEEISGLKEVQRRAEEEGMEGWEGSSDEE